MHLSIVYIFIYLSSLPTVQLYNLVQNKNFVLYKKTLILSIDSHLD